MYLISKPMSRVWTPYYLYIECPVSNIITIHVLTIPDLYSPYPFCTPSLHLISRQYTLSETIWPVSTPSVKPLSTLHPSLHPMSRQCPNVFSPCLAFIQRYSPCSQRILHLYSTNPDRAPSLQHLYYPCQFSIQCHPTLIQSEYYINADVQSEYPLSYPCPVRLLHVLLMYSQYTISPAQIQSVHHLCWPCIVSTLSLLPMLSQYTFIYPSPVRIPPLLPMSSQYIISPAFVQLEYHVSYPCPVRLPHFLALSSQYTTNPVSTSPLLPT